MKPRILILDDEQDIMEDLCTLFRAADYEAAGFTDVASAFSYLEANKVDVICTDIVLKAPDDYTDEETEFGKKTGIAFVRRAKELKPHTHIVAFTVIREEKIREEMKEAGFNEIILKPANFSDILKAAQKYSKSKK